MNDDLISRQAAIDAITNHQKAVLGEYNYDEGIAFGYAAAHRHIIDIVNVLPSEQKWIPVTERKTWKWVERKVVEDGKAIEEWQSAKCSVCGKYHTTPYLYYFDNFNYCPNCGARMESE